MPRGAACRTVDDRKCVVRVELASVGFLSGAVQTADRLLVRMGLFGVLVAAGLITPELAHAAWDKAAFEAKSMEDVLKALGAGKPADSKDVQLSGPDIAENGAVVPVGVKSALPGTEFVAILVEKNPNMVCTPCAIIGCRVLPSGDSG